MLHQYQKFRFPITIINGKDDIKYIKEGREMLKLNNNSKQYIVNEASHNVHLENQDMYLDARSIVYTSMIDLRLFSVLIILIGFLTS